MAEGFEWSKHEKELDRIFFRDFPLISRGSQDHKDFWKFFYRYQKFQAQRGKDQGASSSSDTRDDKDDNTDDSLFSFPRQYDKSYCISFSVMTDDLAYRLRQLQQRREDEGKRKSSLTLEHLNEFRTVLRHFINFQQKQKFDRILKIRQDQVNLPIFQFKEHILIGVRDHQVILIAGDTGCGKSTQVPQYLLRAGYGKIACTQPRRIACLSLAKRVSYETLNEYGTEIAYQVRFEGSKTPATKVLFLTEGLLLRQLSTDSDLNWYDVIIVDEVHERHIHGDFLLGVLRLLIDRRPDLKLILMSATINIQLFSDYFQGAPVIRVPGRLYPIELQYMPVSTAPALQPTAFEKSQKLDPKPYLRVLQLIDTKYPKNERGDLLIFLSGMNEIATLLQEVKTYGQHTDRWIALPLHSALSIEQQDKVFDVAPDGVRKCVISTNIAETSITIDGIRFVIDSGKVKEMGFDPQTKMNRLQEFWISRASAEQRKGRAGRTGPGVCFRLYSESDYDSFPEYATPEIQRVPLESIVLQTTALDLGNARRFPFIEPPSMSNIETSIAFLKDQGALTSDEKLTSTGKMLAQLPVDVVIGKMLIMGSLFHVIEPVLIIAAGLSVQSPFTQSAFSQNEAHSQTIRQELESEHGDPFTILNAFDEWIEVKSEGVRASAQWCRKRGIEQQRLYEMVKLRQQFRDVLSDHHLLDSVESVRDEVRQGENSGTTKGSRWSQLSDKEQQELRAMRKRHRTENKKRKILKMDSEGSVLGEYDGEDREEDLSVAADLKHLEFKLLHDLSQLQDGSSERKTYTLRDINLLKIVVCSGLYPQVAIGDECNASRKGSELIFHTKSKSFLVLHPTSVFSTNPEYLKQEDSHKRPQLLAYEKLLETNRPYMVNTLRVPALQTLLLFSQNIDTNTDCARLVVDEWFEIKFEKASLGQDAVSVVQTLRTTWSYILEMKLAAHQKTDGEDDLSLSLSVSHLSSSSVDIQSLEELLGSRLAEFLDTDYIYSLSQVPSSIRPHLYKGPNATEEVSKDEHKTEQEKPSVKNPLPHPLKGGFMITDYLTYDCLLDGGQAEAFSSLTQHLRTVWICPHCQDSLVVNMAERLAHQGQCEIVQQQKKRKKSEESEVSKRTSSNAKEYHCKECNKVFQFTSVEILKHKQFHKRSK